MSVLFKSLSECGYREPPMCARCCGTDFAEAHAATDDPAGPPSLQVCRRCGLERPVQDGDA